MDLQQLSVPEDVRDYCLEMNYSEPALALFVLGLLIAEVGNQQSRERDGKKPILNKVNFNGMDKARIIRLSNEIVKKLREYKVLKYNEGLYQVHKNLLEKTLVNWNLNKQNALFYLLSGYAYGTDRPRILKQRREADA